MQEITYTIEYVPVWVGILSGVGLALVLCFLMYLIGVPIEKIKSRRRGQRPLYVGFNVISTVLLVGLGVLGGYVTSSASSIPDSGLRGIVTGLVSNLKTLEETSTLSIQDVSVDKAVSAGSESGVGSVEVALSDASGNTFRINRFLGSSLDKLDILVIRDVRVACTSDKECAAYSIDTPNDVIIDSLVRASITMGTVTSIKF